MKILVLGVTGMLGNAIFRYCHENSDIEVWGTLRNPSGLRYFSDELHQFLIPDVDVLDDKTLAKVFLDIKPDVVINCIGVIKQLAHANDPLSVLPINAMLPHRLANLCLLSNSRLIQISTDCVFSGKKGMRTEEDVVDATDLYGMSKYIGEIREQAHVITLRTSIIGHELGSCAALIEWFLSQTGQVNGYQDAIFSGFPTVELANIILNYIIPDTNLFGLYHVSSSPIDKYTLLKLVAKTYGKEIEIIEDNNLSINRSLDSSRFKSATGYQAPAWPELVKLMHEFNKDT